MVTQPPFPYHAWAFKLNHEHIRRAKQLALNTNLVNEYRQNPDVVQEVAIRQSANPKSILLASGFNGCRERI